MYLIVLLVLLLMILSWIDILMVMSFPKNKALLSYETFINVKHMF